MIAGTATAINPSYDSGVSGQVGIVSVMITDTDGNIVVNPSVANILELEDDMGDLTGVYVASRTSPASIGSYVIVWSLDGTFEADSTSAEDLTVVAGTLTPVLPPIPVGPGLGPQFGPGVAWLAEEEAAACCEYDGTDLSVFTVPIAVASQLLFELSGRQYYGTGEQSARPCSSTCGCWGALIAPASPNVWPTSAYSWGWWGGQWGWGFEGCNEICGCGVLSQVPLAGFPVTSIVQVLIDGVAISPAEYRLDQYRYLTRMADANGNPQYWPSCQRLDLEDTEAGTWSVTYTFGQDPPLAGIEAAKQLTCEIYKQCTGQECALPAGVTMLTRQGITIQRAPFVAWGQIDGRWATGLAMVDMFLQTYNPKGHKRPPSVWSPDLPQFAERLGSGAT